MCLIFKQRHFVSKCLRFNGSWLLLLLALYCVSHPLSAVSVEENIPGLQSNIANELSAVITAKQHPQLQISDFSNRADNISRLYAFAGYQLIWFGSDKALQITQSALSVLQQAAEQGLNPENYDVNLLQANLTAAKNNTNQDAKQLALNDTAMSIAMLRYMYHLHFGRTNGNGAEFKLTLRRDKQDLTLLLKDSIASGDFSKLTAQLEPHLKQYQLLKRALANYRTAASSAEMQEFTALLQNNSIANLHQFLMRTGDLSPPNNSPGEVATKNAQLTEEDMAAIKKFQSRHGLADGLPSATELANNASAMKGNIAITSKIEQIKLAMERLRWLPEMADAPGIMVNIPTFELWAFNSMSAMDKTNMTMRVVVGEALKTRTPVLMSKIQFVEFMPQWNVPQSIVNNEIIGKLEHNRNYLRKQNMEIVPSFAKNAPAQLFDVSMIDGLRRGSLRIRQRSGGHNALGRVKFIFPNRYDVYLHDTQANSLFKKTRRDFSHGCVRVENPTALANLLLKEHPKWDNASIKKAMHQEDLQRVMLNKPMPVLIFYSTAFFEQGEQLHFYPDIYGYDEVLQKALVKPADLADNDLMAQSTPAATNSNSTNVLE